MCTSSVAGKTQWLVSIGKLCKMVYGGYQCNGKGVHKCVIEVTILAYGRWCQNGGVVVVDDESVAKMSGGDVDVDRS